MPAARRLTRSPARPAGPPAAALVRALVAWLIAVGLAGLSPAAVVAMELAELRALAGQDRAIPALAAIDRELAKAPRDADLLLLKGQVLARAGRTAEAASVLRTARAGAPDYTDVTLALARTLHQLERRDEAAGLVRNVLAREPANGEAVVLLARLELAGGQPAAARHVLEPYLERAPESGEAHLLLGDAHAAEGRVQLARLQYERALEARGFADLAAERLRGLPTPPPRFRLTLAGSVSEYAASGRSGWREGLGELVYRLDERTQARGNLEVSHRFDEVDTYLAGAVDHRPSDDLTVTLGASVTPDADFRSRWSLGAGFDRKVLDGGENFRGPTVLLGRVIHEAFDAGHTTGARLGIQQYLASGRAWVTVTAGGTRTVEGGLDPNAALRLDLGLTDSLRWSIGGAYGEESEVGVSARTRTVFTGFRLALSDTLAVFVDLAEEDRKDSPKRRSVTTGLVIDF